MALNLVFNQVVLTEGIEIHLVSTFFILQTFLSEKKKKKKKNNLIFAKFLTIENVHNLTIYSWSHIEIPISLELNNIGP